MTSPLIINLNYDPRNDFLDTGVEVVGGITTIQINASGFININWPSYPNDNDPDGILAAPLDVETNLPVAALIGKIGIDGSYFMIGSNYNQIATSSGRLYVGIWDVQRTDNSGSFEISIQTSDSPTPTPTPTPTSTPTPTLTLTPSENFCERVMVFSICNANAARDDNFDILLNNTLIGSADLNSDSKIGSVFIGSLDTNLNIIDPDFECSMSDMVVYYFDPAIIINGTNEIKMQNTQLNNNGNWGIVGIRNYLVNGSNLYDPCYINNLNYSGATGASFDFDFDFEKCCYPTPGPEDQSCNGTTIKVSVPGSILRSGNYTDICFRVGGPDCCDSGSENLWSNEVCVPIPTLVDFSINWTTSQTGIIESCGSGGWQISNSGLTIKYIVQDSKNCGGCNNSVQSGTAVAEISTGNLNYYFDYDLEGIGELQDANFEIMDLFLEEIGSSVSTKLISARARDENRGCFLFGPVDKTILVPSPVLLEANKSYKFTLNFTTNDALYHVGCYYECSLAFYEATELNPTPTPTPTPTTTANTPTPTPTFTGTPTATPTPTSSSSVPSMWVIGSILGLEPDPSKNPTFFPQYASIRYYATSNSQVPPTSGWATGGVSYGSSPAPSLNQISCNVSVDGVLTTQIGYEVSGAGDANANGTYCIGGTLNGRNYYVSSNNVYLYSPSPAISQNSTPTPTSTPTSTPTLTSTNTSTPTPTPTLTSTNTSTPTPTSTLTSTPTPSTPFINNLFDKSSWASVVPQPYLNYLDQAADRWAQYIKYNSSVAAAISSDDPTWSGLRLHSSSSYVETIPSSTFIVSVLSGSNSFGSGNKFHIDGSTSPTLPLVEGQSYIFDLSHPSNANHPFRFSTTSDGTHAGGTEYLTGVTVSGTPGQPDAYVSIVISSGEPTIHYYCSNHSGMGGAITTTSAGTIASCGIVLGVDLVPQPGAPGVQLNATSFALSINTIYENEFSENDWINILTHELGHALGIGILWSPNFQSNGSIPPTNNFLSGTAYANCQSAYNSITSNNNYVQVPLESTGSSGTASAHWEDEFRPSSATGSGGLDHIGVVNELMVGYYSAGMNSVISDMSIKILVDFGYEEVNPGSNEGIPILDTGVSIPFMKQNNLIKLNCGCDNPVTISRTITKLGDKFVAIPKLMLNSKYSEFNINIGSNKWLDTNIEISKNSKLIINASGESYWNLPEISLATPDGVLNPNPQVSYTDCCVCSSLPYMALIGQIGDGQEFLVGSELVDFAKESGKLKLRVNNKCPRTIVGSYNITISVQNYISVSS